MTKFRAWIPNISGKLSFSQIGLSNDSRVSTNVFNSVDLTGKIIAKQTRVSNDGPIPPSLQRLLSFRDPRQIFVIQAQVRPGFLIAERPNYEPPVWVRDERAILDGKVFIQVPSPWIINCIHPSSLQQKMRDFETALKYAQTRLSDGNSFIETDWNDHLKKQANKTDNWYECSFQINRFGECTIDIESTGILQDTTCVQTLRSYANQVFFCLRDLIHRHYHHNTDEELLGVTFPLNTPEGHYDDRTWRRETLYGLTRLALQARRNSAIGDSKNAIGIIAYAKSFQKLLGHWKYKSEPQCGISPKSELISDFSRYNFDSMISSLKAGISHAEWTRSRGITSMALCTAIFATILTLTLGAIRLKHLTLSDGERLELPKTLIQIIDFIVSYPVQIALVFPTVIGLLIFIYSTEFRFKRDTELRIHRLENAALNSINAKTKIPILSWVISIVINLIIISAFISAFLWAVWNLISLHF